MSYFQALSFRRFQHEFDRVNLHRPTEQVPLEHRTRFAPRQPLVRHCRRRGRGQGVAAQVDIESKV